MSSPSAKKKPEPERWIKRRFPRYHSDVRVVATMVRNHEEVVVDGRCSLLSEGGMGGIIASELVLGDVVSLEFCLPVAEDPIQVRAVVRYRNGLYYGLEFVALSPEQRQAIRKFCKPLPPLQ